MRNILMSFVALIIVQSINAAVVVKKKDVPEVVRTDIALNGDDAKNLIKLFNLNKNMKFISGKGDSRFYLEIDSTYSVKNLRLSGGADLTWYWIDCEDITSQNPSCEVSAVYSITNNQGYVRRFGNTVYVSVSEHDFPGSSQSFLDGVNLQRESGMSPHYVANIVTGGLGIKIYCTNETNKSCGLQIRFP